MGGPLSFRRAAVSKCGENLRRAGLGYRLIGWLPMQEISTFLWDFADRYTAAWCSQNPTAVASFFAPAGSLTINAGSPSVGRGAITEAAQAFMTAFPDLRVVLDRLVAAGERIEYHWTLTGTNTGLGGTGRAVRIAGFERWQLDGNGLILDSEGHFDAAEYDRQLSGGS